MTSDEATAFIEYCRVQRGLSNNSLQAYEQDLRAFESFKQDYEPDHETTSSTILTFANFLRETKSLSPSTVRRRIVILRAYFEWRVETKQQQRSPFDGLALELKVPQRLPKPIDRPTLSHLFQNSKRIKFPIIDPAKLQITNIDHQQVTGLIARIIISTGLRIGEITRTRISDVSNGGTCIHVRGKGNRERSAYLGNEALIKYFNYYIQLRKINGNPDDYLFLNTRGKRLSEPAFRKRLRTMSDQLEISPPLTPHRFRHSAATMLIEEGVDIRFVQRLLGHASISTTEIYTKISDNSLISAIKRADTLSKSKVDS